MAACESDSSAPSAHGGDASDDAGTSARGSVPSPALVIANGGDATLSIVDPSTLAVVETLAVETGLHPHHLGVSPDGSRVLVTATSTDLSLGHGGAHAGHGAAASTTVYLLDAAEGTLRNVIAVDATAHNAAFTPDGSTIVLAMMEHGMVAGYDATTFTEVFSVTGFNMPLEVTPTANGDLLVAESGAGTIATVDVAARTVTNRFDVGAVPVAAWASGGDDYFVSVEEGMRVRHLIATSDEVELDAHEMDPQGMPGQAILNPDATELWVAVEDRGVVVVFDASTHEKLAEIEAGSSPHGIAFDPSGERAFVTDQGGSEVLVIDAQARTTSSIIEVGTKPNGIVWLAHE